MDIATRIEVMVDRALTWADRHFDLFRAKGSQEDRVQTTLKPLLELSVLCMLHRRQPESHTDPRIHRLLEASAEMWKTNQGCDRLVRNPDAFRLYGMWYESLVQSGGTGLEDWGHSYGLPGRSRRDAADHGGGWLVPG